MKIIFHIGMGKTGTSSLQQTLAANADELQQQKTHYLGMWFGLIAPEYNGLRGVPYLFCNSPEEQRALARRFYDACATKTGFETFILSNEGIFDQIRRAVPFFEALGALADVSFVLYIRDPQSWLPSAFTQWGIRHKEQPGPVQPFETRARTLISSYDAVRNWQENFGERLQVRRHSPEIDVTQDFAETVGITLSPLDQRFLERGEDSEIVLRALFNDRYSDRVLPELFNKVVLNTNRRPVADLDEMIHRCFDMDNLDEIIAERAETFAYIRDMFGFDFTTVNPKPRTVDEDAVRARLLDYLTEIVLQQGTRIYRLEMELANLKAQPKA